MMETMWTAIGLVAKLSNYEGDADDGSSPKAVLLEMFPNCIWYSYANMDIMWVI